MNSQLMQVKQQVHALSGDAESMAGALGGLKTRFGTTADRVQSSIGGSARQADRTMIASLRAAEKQLESAIAALRAASQEGKKFASSL